MVGTGAGLALAVAIGVALGFFGGGGSILTVPLLVYVFGLGAREAIASSLLVVAVTSAVGAVQHWRAGNVRLRTGLLFGTAGMAGAYAGGRAGALVEEGVLLLLFAAMMLLTGAAMWRRGGAPGPAAGGHAPWKLVLQGLAVGSFTGLVGAGGGFLIVPALVLWAGLPTPAAVGTSLLVIVLQTLAGFGGWAARVAIDARLVATVAACAVAGSFVGVRLIGLVEPRTARRAFAAFVLVLGAAIVARQGALAAEAGLAALPRSAPQVIFAIAMLAIGVWAGRVSRGRGAPDTETFREGAGI